MTTTIHYRPRITTEHNHLESIAHAYRTCGLQPPTRATDLRQLLADEPSPDALALELATESLTVDDLEPWTEVAIDRIRRAQAVDTLRRAVLGLGASAAKRNRHNLTRAATSDLAKPFTATVKQLTTAAAGLPPGDNPLDLEAVVETDATAQRREAQQALRVLAAIAGVHRLPTAAGLSPQARDMLLVVDVPDVPLADVAKLTREVLNPDEQRDHVRAMLRDALKHGADRALIGVARGEYGEQVVLSLAADETEVRARIERAETAAGGRVVDTWGYRNTAAEAEAATKPALLQR